jgi:hypothetical protein
MSKLIELNDLNISNFVELLRDSEIMIYENIQGSKVYVNYDGKEFNIRPKSIDAEPINKIDLALQKYYEPIFDYFNMLDERVKAIIPKNITFFCSFFNDNIQNNINYDNVPKNQLILNAIVKDNKFIYDFDIINEYSRLLEISMLPYLFKGKLSNKQLELITYFLNTPSEDLKFIFDEDNFASFFYKILNPNITCSFLSNNFNDNVDKFIIKIDNNINMTFAILNPMYMRSDKVKSEFSDTYNILLADFVEFCQILNWNSIKLKNTSSDMMYIEIVCAMFNAYCKTRMDKIINYDFTVPQFMYQDKFKINTNLITNKNTIDFIKQDEKIEYLFKIILSNFRFPKKDCNNILTKEVILNFNLIVKNIQNTIDRKLKINKETNGLLNFDEFYKVNYSTDANGQVYPNNTTEEKPKSIVKK